MTKTLFLGGVLAAALIVGCSGAPGTGSPAPGGTDGDAALQQLCDDQNEAGLNQLATQLEGVDENTDTSALTTLIGQTLANLESATVPEGQQSVRDSAVTALGTLDAALADPATRQTAATAAAGTLRAAETGLCAG